MSKLAQLKEILALLSDEAVPTVLSQDLAPRPVLVRTYSAGVHFGMLESRSGKEVVLTGARRVWHWKGANTLNELVANGPAAGSKISEPTAKILLTEAIEVIELTPDQHARLAGVKWA